MRAIRFRGQDKDGKWLYGDLRQRMGYWPTIIENYRTYNDGKVGYREIAVKKETVGQFTSLRDKNGKEIYEGDLVRYGERNYVVSYEDSHKGAFSLIRNNTFVGCFGTPYPFEPFYVEVVGNIHDNPKMIKRR